MAIAMRALTTSESTVYVSWQLPEGETLGSGSAIEIMDSFGGSVLRVQGVTGNVSGYTWTGCAKGETLYLRLVAQLSGGTDYGTYTLTVGEDLPYITGVTQVEYSDYHPQEWTITKPPTQEGDLLLTVVSSEGSDSYSVTPPSGWTILRSYGKLVIYSKQCGASEPGSYTWTWNTTGNSGVMHLIAVRGGGLRASKMAGVTIPSNGGSGALPVIAGAGAGDLILYSLRGVSQITSMGYPAGVIEDGYGLIGEGSPPIRLTLLAGRQLADGDTDAQTVGGYWYPDSYTSDTLDAICLAIGTSTTPVDPDLPQPPTLLAVERVDDSAKITWTPSPDSTSEGNTLLYRATSAAGPYTLIQTLHPEALEYTDGPLAVGKYYYCLSYTDGDDESAKTAPLSVTIGDQPVGAPTLAATSGASSIALSWTTVTAATSYRIYRGRYSGSLSLIGSTTGLEYQDRGAIPGVTYYYEVEGVNGVGAGDRSNRVSAARTAAAAVTYTITITRGGRE